LAAGAGGGPLAVVIELVGQMGLLDGTTEGPLPAGDVVVGPESPLTDVPALVAAGQDASDFISREARGHGLRFGGGFFEQAFFSQKVPPHLLDQLRSP
jgi:hypothetical protein